MDAKRGAWTRKRPGQASGSDYPRQGPPSPMGPRGRAPAPNDYNEPPMPRRRGSSPEGEYQGEANSRVSGPAAQAPNTRRKPVTSYQEEVLIQRPQTGRGQPPRRRESVRMDARAPPSPPMHRESARVDSKGIPKPRLSIEPEMRRLAPRVDWDPEVGGQSRRDPRGDGRKDQRKDELRCGQEKRSVYQRDDSRRSSRR